MLSRVVETLDYIPDVCLGQIHCYARHDRVVLAREVQYRPVGTPSIPLSEEMGIQGELVPVSLKVLTVVKPPLGLEINHFKGAIVATNEIDPPVQHVALLFKHDLNFGVDHILKAITI